MLTLSWRRAGASSALAMALVVGLPALAQAQLFPNMWIQRERTPCPNEPPFYAHIRHNYYGYYPTCWRKFPEGWACPCPNPELPDAAASFAKVPRDARPEAPPTDEEMDLDRGSIRPPAGPRPDAGRPPGIDGTDMPPLPEGIRPLDEPRRPGTPNPNAPAGPGTVPGRPGDATPRVDPFDPIRQPLPRSNGAGASSRGPATEGPSLEPPQGTSAATELPPLNDAFADAGKPVLALPEMSPTAGAVPADTALTPPMPSSLPPDATIVEAPPTAAPAPAQAPRRQGLIGGLLNMGNWRRR
jgi:hypothetical protein